MARPQESRLKGTAKEKNESQPAVSQDSCMLLRLPGEIRNLIYSHLFTSTRLTFGERSTSRVSAKRMKPAPNSLAILRTCSLVKQEAGGLWLGQVLFNFENPEDMLDKLSELPSTTLSQIRYIRVGDDDDVYYRLVWVLKLLPDLCLDTLSVLGMSNGDIAYDTLSGLVKYGNGWKELRYITPNSEMLGFKRLDLFMADPYWRQPQPSTWNDILIQRDGLDSRASVTIYRSTQSGTPGAVLKPETRQLFEQKPSTEDLEMFGVEEDKQLLGMNERGKELLVVVRRGYQADISEQDSPPYLLENDIRQWAHGLTWAEIRRQCIDFLAESSDDDDPDFIEKGEDVEADRYNDVDEYEWNSVI
ncbi:conserved hypothetical protein [Talaromyces stipitatus ATCC 10500]|uniref:F-box domain protein n=1 Tax=Talaromyces stipitatus (strain ATCC 10500 / CBS 375.48 / QM 6759 / NRRL 1006) TaxID=441959 RepID=B8MAH9_TALSN|nr:uncharacterized protein TSTA_112360 [Talaromyces stipitatus ATCC 10500]EED17403.1 conserved hypothetical protein [Talaromyces stipitatus ATCC 10500]